MRAEIQLKRKTQIKLTHYLGNARCADTRVMGYLRLGEREEGKGKGKGKRKGEEGMTV